LVSVPVHHFLVLLVLLLHFEIVLNKLVNFHYVFCLFKKIVFFGPIYFIVGFLVYFLELVLFFLKHNIVVEILLCLVKEV
jgi:hypothetical protein